MVLFGEIVTLAVRSGGGLGGLVLGFLSGDGEVFFLGRGGPGGGIVGVAVGGAPLLGRHVAEAIQRDGVAVAVAGLELRQMGDRVGVGLLLGFGLGLLARGGAGALGRGGRGSGGAVFCDCRDAGMEGAVLGRWRCGRDGSTGGW